MFPFIVFWCCGCSVQLVAPCYWNSRQFSRATDYCILYLISGYCRNACCLDVWNLHECPRGCPPHGLPVANSSSPTSIKCCKNWVKTMRASNWLLPFRAVLPQSWRILPFWVPVCQTHRVLPQTLGETFWLGNPWSEAVICASLNPHGPTDTCSDCPNYTGAPVILNSPGHRKLTISCINSKLYIGRYSIQHHSRSFWAILKWGITGITEIWCNIWQKATRIKQEPISQGLGVLPLKMSAFGGRVGWDGAGKNPCLLGPDHSSPLQKLKACQREYYADTPCT